MTGCSPASRSCSIELHMPRSLQGVRRGRGRVPAALPALAMTAFEDLSNRTNPRMPLVTEITELLQAGLLRH